MGDWQTTITRQGQTIATIQWKVFAKSTLTMDGKTSKIDEVLTKSKKWSL
jgi:hypothetical protein